MKVINIVNALKNDQYLETTNDPSNPLRRVDKPGFICLFSQALEFAKVLEVVQEALNSNEIMYKTFGAKSAEVTYAKKKLSERYVSFIQKHSSFALMLTSFFLWVLGYREENSLESMAKGLQKGCVLFAYDEKIKKGLKHNFYLEHITLGCRVTDEGVKLVAQHYPHVKEIDFDAFNYISSESCEFFSQRCSEIRNMDLGNCKVEIAKILLQNCPQLTELRLNSAQMTDDTLEYIAEKCPLLERVEFDSDSEITYNGFRNFLKKCSKIHRFPVRIKNLSSEQKEALFQLVKGRANPCSDHVHIQVMPEEG